MLIEMKELEQATQVLSATVLARYSAMEWFDGDEGQREEAQEMADALEEGDVIAVGVALDRALLRWDCLGAYDCHNCGKNFGNPNNECECGDPTDTLYEETKEIEAALVALRKAECGH